MVRDIFHDAVRQGLEKEGWLITDDPLKIKSGDVNIQIDLGAKNLIAAEKDEDKIAVAITSFIGESNISSFHIAVGQFVNYQIALEDKQPEQKLYLAVPLSTYRKFFYLLFVQTVIQRFHIPLVIYKPSEEVIVEWKS